MVKKGEKLNLNTIELTDAEIKVICEIWCPCLVPRACGGDRLVGRGVVYVGEDGRQAGSGGSCWSKQGKHCKHYIKVKGWLFDKK